MNKQAQLTPFGQAVMEEMTLLEVERELVPDRYACERDAGDEVCGAWGITQAERREQLELVATMKYQALQSKLALAG